MLQLVDITDLKRSMDRANRALAYGAEFAEFKDVEIAVRPMNGPERIFLLNARPLRNPDNDFLILLAFDDITE